MSPRPASRWGGRRPDGTYAEGPRGVYNPFWEHVGDISASRRRDMKVEDAEAAGIAERRSRRRAQPAPQQPTSLVTALAPHPRTCKRAVRLIGPSTRRAA